MVACELQEALQIYALPLSMRLDAQNNFEESFAFSNDTYVVYDCVGIIILLSLLFDSRRSNDCTLGLSATSHSGFKVW